MRMINSRHFQAGCSNFAHHLHDLFGCHFVARCRVSRDIFRRKCAADDSIPAGEKAATLDPRILSRVTDQRLQHVALNLNRIRHEASLPREGVVENGSRQTRASTVNYGCAEKLKNKREGMISRL